MRQIAFIIGTLLLGAVHFAEGSVIQKLSKSEDKDSLQIFLSFDAVPQFDTQTNGKRLDIILKQTELAEGIELFEADERIIKTLARQVKDDLELSLFFRYIPQAATFSKSGTNLVGDILLGNRFTKTYRNLTSSLEGVTLLERSTQDFANPLVASPFAHNWKTFFTTYESDITIECQQKTHEITRQLADLLLRIIILEQI